ncbi:hypothetical protein ABZV14_29310 [Streptosporangium canum]|uniref:hypothetical protein n=1 Tax=Streptosporangium canum TaxID=324952 RepID=UPI0033A72837
MSRVLTVMPAAALALAVLTGCGTEAAPSAAPTAAGKTSATADPHGKRRQMETMRADCMKRKGFKYQPYVPSGSGRMDRDLREIRTDYATLLKQREERGFGVFYPYVHPDQPSGPEEAAKKYQRNPNLDLAGKLSDTQSRAREATDKACYAAAYKKLTGKTVTPGNDTSRQMNKMYEQAANRELDGDPRLVELAAAYGDCLKGKGYPVISLKPTTMSRNTRSRFDAELEEALSVRRGQGTEDGADPELTPDEAKPYLAKEIKASLDDLECGKGFYTEFLPRNTELGMRIFREFGGEDGLLS